MLSCPAYFSEEQREAMAVAGEKAGIVVLDTIDEPVVNNIRGVALRWLIGYIVILSWLISATNLSIN